MDWVIVAAVVFAGVLIAGAVVLTRRQPAEPLAQEVGGRLAQMADAQTAGQAQIGERLAFWIYLVIDDVNVESYARHLTEHGSPAEVEAVALFGTLGLRTSDGTPKPALETWDRLRDAE